MEMNRLSGIGRASVEWCWSISESFRDSDTEQCFQRMHSSDGFKRYSSKATKHWRLRYAPSWTIGALLCRWVVSGDSFWIFSAETVSRNENWRLNETPCSRCFWRLFDLDTRLASLFRYPFLFNNLSITVLHHIRKHYKRYGYDKNSPDSQFQLWSSTTTLLHQAGLNTAISRFPCFNYSAPSYSLFCRRY